MLNCCQLDSFGRICNFNGTSIKKEACIQDLLITGLVLSLIITLGALLATIANSYNLFSPFSFVNSTLFPPALGVLMAGSVMTTALAALVARRCSRQSHPHLAPAVAPIQNNPDSQRAERNEEIHPSDVIPAVSEQINKPIEQPGQIMEVFEEDGYCDEPHFHESDLNRTFVSGYILGYLQGILDTWKKLWNR